MLYLFFKCLHIVAIISWMAGILYLIRLFVNHRQYGASNEANHLLLTGMEERLYRLITFPALCVAWGAGLSMIVLVPPLLDSHWLKVKLLLVVLLTAFTLWSGKVVQRFSQKQFGELTTKKLRILNEVPTILMVFIVFLVVYKPF